MEQAKWTLAEIDEQSLAASAFIAVGEQEFYQCKEIFNLMGLPIPQFGGYYPQPNSDRFYNTKGGWVGTMVYQRRNPLMVGAERIGLIKKAKAPVFDAAFVATDDVLQPLLRVTFKNLVFEINAGVKGVSRDGEKRIRTLQRNLKQNGLFLVNNHPESLGVLPDADEGEDLTLLRNRRAFIIKNPSLIHEDTARQDRIFGELRTDFADALQSGRQERFKAVFAKCARIVALPSEDPRRILRPYWAESTPQTLRQQDIVAAARIYGRQLEAA